MNVLYLHCHDAGRYISPWKATVPTPRLERFSRQATVFRQAFCAAPTCSPSRAALLTGTYSHQAGMTGLSHRGFSLSQPEQHLAAFLKRQGFQTALAGIQHEFNEVPASAYDESHVIAGPKGSAWDRDNAGWAARWLREKKEKPFFLSCGFFLPHREFPEVTAGAETDPRELPPGVPNTAETRHDMARYFAALAEMDECCGLVLNALAASPHAEDTMVIFTTDHGPPFPFMKCNLTDRGLGVALMLAWPGNPKAGRQVEAIVSHLDIYPTLCELLNLPGPAWLEGTSLLPLLRDEARAAHDALFAEVNFHVGYEPMRSIRTESHKLIEIFAEDTRPFPGNTDPSPSRDAVEAEGGLDQPRARIHLYDLRHDPDESHSLAEDPSQQGLAQDLHRQLHEWMARTNDPLLEGKVSPPSHARLEPRERAVAA